LALPTIYDDVTGLSWLKTVSTFTLSGLVMRVWIGSHYKGLARMAVLYERGDKDFGFVPGGKYFG
jgi:hypothetical protein